ncbi:hypothetical protein EDD15DRAFT_2292549 [Pisolithus albus]|nr:hypothetical protein EDD15DRAFT_2292549 [Pisolithus albus]
MLLEEGYHFELREAHFARDQWSAREAQCKAEMRELRAVQTEEQCRGLEKCSESARLGSKASQPPSSTLLEIRSLTHNLQDSSKPSKAPGVGSRSQAVEVDGIEVAVAEPSSSALVEGRCESSFDQIQVTSYIAKDKEKLLGVKASVKLEVTEALGDSLVSQPKYLHPSSSPCTDIPPQNPSIKP